MKTMKLWRIAFMMLAAFSLASCSSDDDNEDKVEQVTLYVMQPIGSVSVSWKSRGSPTSAVTSTNCW